MQELAERGRGCRWTTEAPPSFAVKVKEDRKEDENHRSRRDHEIDRPNMHSFQRQTIGDCLVLGAGRGGFTHICVGRGSPAGRMSGELAPRAPPADCPGSGCSCRVLTTEFSVAAVTLHLRASHTTQAPLQMTPPVLWLLAAFLLLSEVLHRSPLDSPLSVWPCWTEGS